MKTLPFILLLCLAGCASRTITMPDGTTVKSTAIFYRSAIQSFTFITKDGTRAEVHGYKGEAQAKEIEAITRAAVRGAVDGAVPMSRPPETIDTL